MSKLALADVQNTLENLVQQRMQHVDTLLTGPLYRQLIIAKLAEIKTLPERTAAQPYAEELTQSDLRHDGYGRAVWRYIEAILALPQLEDRKREAAIRIRTAFVPELRQLTARYALEIHRARARRPMLVVLADDLALFPTVDGTLADWVRGMLDAAEEMENLLSKRADVLSKQKQLQGSLSNGLRMESMGLLSRLRAAIRDEQSVRPELPANLEGLILGYYDEIVRKRNERRTGIEGEALPAEEAAEATDETDDMEDVGEVPVQPPEEVPEQAEE